MYVSKKKTTKRNTRAFSSNQSCLLYGAMADADNTRAKIAARMMRYRLCDVLFGVIFHAFKKSSLVDCGNCPLIRCTNLFDDLFMLNSHPDCLSIYPLQWLQATISVCSFLIAVVGRNRSPFVFHQLLQL